MSQPSKQNALPAAQEARTIELLQQRRHLLILDNLESVTGQELAIRNELASDEREALRRFLARLHQARSLVLLGSRSAEAWLERGVFEDNRMEPARQGLLLCFAPFTGVLNRTHLLPAYIRALGEEEAYRQALKLHGDSTALGEAERRRLGAGILHQLGIVMQAQRRRAEAREHGLNALRCAMETNASHEADIILRGLARTGKEAPDASIPASVAQAEAKLSGAVPPSG